MIIIWYKLRGHNYCKFYNCDHKKQIYIYIQRMTTFWHLYCHPQRSLYGRLLCRYLCRLLIHNWRRLEYVLPNSIPLRATKRILIITKNLSYIKIHFIEGDTIYCGC